ncbi:MAG: hypothetical protein ACI85O_000512 [Saprospiraceae bacterium]|jgi:hypothetical protein
MKDALFLFPSVLFAQIDTLPVKSSVKEVTVFNNAAQIFRKGTIDVPRGKTILAFRGIAKGINGQSIQVNTKSSITILSVNNGQRYTGDKVYPADIQVLKLKQAEKNIEIRRLNAELQVYQQEEKLLLAHLNTRGTDKELSAANMRETATYLRGQLLEVKQKLIDISLAIAKIKAENYKILREEQNLQRGGKGEYETEIFVAVEAKSATSADFTISYLQNSAGWFPNYDVRVADINEPVNLTYKASVYQSTGEDWKDVKLTLSTGEPSTSGNKPNLDPWRLFFGRNGRHSAVRRGSYNGNQVKGYVLEGETGEPLIGVTVMLKGTSIGTSTDFDGSYILNLPAQHNGILVVSYTGFDTQQVRVNGQNTIISLNAGATLDEVVVRSYKVPLVKKEKRKDFLPKPIATNQTEEATSIEFDIEIPYSIPSDNKKYSVAIANYSLPAGYEYFAAPKIEQSAYLTAQVTDWGKYNLLTGEMNLFFNGTYLGKSILDFTGTNDTLTLSLGKDKSVIVKRDRDEEYTDRQFIGNKKTVETGWTIEMRNKKSKAIKIQIEDQYPLSSNDDIEVKLASAKKAIINEDTGKLIWELELAPNSSEKISFQYSVKYPKSKQLVLE